MPIFAVQESFPESILDSSEIKINNSINNINNKNNLVTNIHKVNDNINNITDISIKIESNIKNNDKNDIHILKNKKRPNSYKKTGLYKYNEINIPKFHQNVNDPGNELAIMKKEINNIFPKKQPKSNNLNGKTQDLCLPNYYFSNHIDTPEVYDNVQATRINYDLSGNIQINEKNNNINLNPKSDDFNLSGFIPGSNNKNKAKLKKANTKNDYCLTGKIPGINDTKPTINFYHSANCILDSYYLIITRLI